MKILVFTDLHASRSSLKKIQQKAKDVDLIINCGDFTVFTHEIEFFMDEFEKLNKPMLILHGNHEDEEIVEELCKHYQNLTFIHEKTFDINNILIIGHGGGGFSQKDPSFVNFSKKVKRQNKDQKTILITHQPPYNTNLDRLYSRPTGNEDYSNFINKFQPNYAFSGHIHENENKKDKIGKTVLWNPGPHGKIIDL